MKLKKYVRSHLEEITPKSMTVNQKPTFEQTEDNYSYFNLKNPNNLGRDLFVKNRTKAKTLNKYKTH